MQSLKVCSGFGNRLQAMVVACCMPRPPRQVVWTPQKYHCPAQAVELIDTTGWPFAIVSRSKATFTHITAPVTPLPRHVMSGTLFHRVPSSAGMAVMAARHIRPSRRVDRMLRHDLLATALGIHVRRGDKANVCARDDSLGRLRVWLAQHAAVRTIVVCTDSEAVYRRIKKEHPRHIVVRPSTNVGRDNVVGAAVDFFSLVQCRHFIGNRGSSFSRMICLIRAARR